MFYFYLLLQIILVIVLFFVAGYFFNILFRGQAPLFLTKQSILKTVISEIKLSPKDIFYELGSGTGNLLCLLKKKYPNNKLIGIENTFFPWLVSKLKCWNQNNIIIKKQNIFKTNLSLANYIYCFLNIETMEKLEKKVLAECRPGTIIISYIFQFPNLKPEKVLYTKNHKNNIYFYTL